MNNNMIICNQCTDPTWCNVQKCCAIEEEIDIDRLEDERQSEAYYQLMSRDPKK
jgi:hypothetical protein